MQHAVKLRGANFFSSSSIIFAGSFAINVLNYVFTLIMSRLLGVEEFGEVTVLISLLLIISVPATALTMLMAREAAAAPETDTAALFYFLRKHVWIGALVFWMLFLITTPVLVHLLHIPLFPFFIFSLLIPFAGLTALQSGALQGMQEFFMLAKQGVLSAGVKLSASLLLVFMGWKVSGVVTALVFAQLVGWAYGYFATRKKMIHNPINFKFDARQISGMFGVILLTTLLLALLSNLDVLLAKHYLSATLAGQYSALATMGKIIIFGVGAFTTVLLPMASAAHANGKGEERTFLTLSLSVTLCAAVGAWIVFTLFPEMIVSILFGVRYLPITDYMGTFAVVAGSMALAVALINYFVAIRNTSFLYFVSFGLALEVVLVAMNHSTLGAIVGSLVVSSVALLLMLGCNYILIRKHYLV